MNYLISLFLLSLIIACQPLHSSSSDEAHNDSLLIARTAFDHQEIAEQVINYDSLIQSIASRKAVYHTSFHKAYNNDTLQAAIRAEAQQYLLHQLTTAVFPAWYGTPWDFNGISETPREGLIACGYFVSTTLKQVGFNLNRYRVAQADATTIAKTLCQPVKTFRAFDALKAYLAQQPDNLFVVGLDNHVGFIEKTVDGIFFTHASYYDPVEVVRQPIEQAPILEYSNVYILGHLLSGNEVIDRWIKGTKIEVQ